MIELMTISGIRRAADLTLGSAGAAQSGENRIKFVAEPFRILHAYSRAKKMPTYLARLYIFIINSLQILNRGFVRHFFSVMSQHEVGSVTGTLRAAHVVLRGCPLTRTEDDPIAALLLNKHRPLRDLRRKEVRAQIVDL